MIGLSLVCHLCREPLDVTVARTDDEGKAVHSECYARATRKAEASHPPEPSEKVA